MYDIIYADPPWSYRNKQEAGKYYTTLDVETIKKLNVNSISSENSILFIWGTWPNLQECLDVIVAWGFTYKTIGFVWVKKNKIADSFFWGTGSWTRANSEFCLIATKGKPKRINMGIHQIIYEPITKHSEKPFIVRDKIISLVGDLPKIELFARHTVDGWDRWGNECDNSVELNFEN